MKTSVPSKNTPAGWYLFYNQMYVHGFWPLGTRHRGGQDSGKYGTVVSSKHFTINQEDQENIQSHLSETAVTAYYYYLKSLSTVRTPDG